MRGRKPTPTALKLLTGNPGKRAINHAEPQAPAGIPEAPAFLDDTARAEWNSITIELHRMGMLSPIDKAALAAYCANYSTFAAAQAEVKKSGIVVKINGQPSPNPYLSAANKAAELMRKFLVEFGLTPSSRSRIRANPPEEEGELAKMMREAG
jgi:P27 family predicted phage terminase small subunit